jgi:hypothetical protein
MSKWYYSFLIFFKRFILYISFLHYFTSDSSSMTFVRSSLNPQGNNASADEGLWYLTFYVALFLIHSIWEQVPNTQHRAEQWPRAHPRWGSFHHEALSRLDRAWIMTSAWIWAQGHQRWRGVNLHLIQSVFNQNTIQYIWQGHLQGIDLRFLCGNWLISL